MGRDTLRVSDLVLTSQLRPDEPPRPVPSGIVYSETMNALVELTGEDMPRLGASKVVIHVSETEASPTLVSAPAQVLPRSDVQRGFLSLLKLGVLPPGEYVARAVVSIPGEPDTTVFRPFRLAPVAAPTDRSPIADRVADDLAPMPLPVAKHRRTRRPVHGRRGARAGRRAALPRVAAAGSPGVGGQRRHHAAGARRSVRQQPAGRPHPRRRRARAFVRPGAGRSPEEAVCAGRRLVPADAQASLGFSRRRVLPRCRARGQRPRQRRGRRVADVDDWRQRRRPRIRCSWTATCASATRRRRST